MEGDRQKLPGRPNLHEDHVALAARQRQEIEHSFREDRLESFSDLAVREERNDELTENPRVSKPLDEILVGVLVRASDPENTRSSQGREPRGRPRDAPQINPERLRERIGHDGEEFARSFILLPGPCNLCGD